MSHIGLVTCDQYREMATDDVLLEDALNARGHRADRPAWDDPHTDWASYDALIIRSTWDYQWRLPEFLGWLDRIEAAGARLYNPPAVLRWNSHKTYLRELESRGVAVAPTEWIDPGEPLDLARRMDARGWTQAVVKPAIGAGGFATFLVQRTETEGHAAHTAAELTERGAMMQEFLPEVLDPGEISLLFFRGQFSHAVIKKPSPQDFRVQDHWGGVTGPTTVAKHIVDQAVAILPLAPGELLYARVDGIVRGDRFILIELEVFEPWLYFKYSEDTLERFVTAVEQTIVTQRRSG